MSLGPIIGITAGSARTGEQAESCALPLAYVRAVERAEGIPVVLPVQRPERASAILPVLHGLLLSGGGDIDPRLFGEEPRPGLGRIDPERDAWELALVRAALAAGLPLLAVCRGMQVLNVAAGGTLYQDIPRELPAALKHVQDAPRWHPTHSVRILPGSRLAALLGLTQENGIEVPVNSFHHQAVRQVAPGLQAVAIARDGVIEAIEAVGDTGETGTPGRFVVGVQWHPEGMWERHPALLGLFAGVAAAARRRMEARG